METDQIAVIELFITQNSRNTLHYNLQPKPSLFLVEFAAYPSVYRTIVSLYYPPECALYALSLI